MQETREEVEGLAKQVQEHIEEMTGLLYQIEDLIKPDGENLTVGFTREDEDATREGLGLCEDMENNLNLWKA